MTRSRPKVANLSLLLRQTKCKSGPCNLRQARICLQTSQLTGIGGGRWNLCQGQMSVKRLKSIFAISGAASSPPVRGKKARGPVHLAAPIWPVLLGDVHENLGRHHSHTCLQRFPRTIRFVPATWQGPLKTLAVIGDAELSSTCVSSALKKYSPGDYEN